MLGRKFVMIGLVMCVSAVAVGCKDKGLEEVNTSLDAIIHPIKVDTNPLVVELAATNELLEIKEVTVERTIEVIEHAIEVVEDNITYLEASKVETEPSIEVTGPIPPEIEDVVVGISTLVVVLPDTVEAVDVVAELAK